MQQQPQQVFTLGNLTGDDIQAIMNGLNELPSKIGRNTMNKLEAQIIAQIQAAQTPPTPPEDKKAGTDDESGVAK